MSRTKKCVRIEYELPPLRAIYSVWYDDVAEMLDDEIREAFGRDKPRAVIRKFERGIEVPEEEMTNIIGSLPTTTDGVLFAQGKVYVPGSFGGKPCVFDYPATARWVGIRPYISHVWGEKIELAFSTQEACEAYMEAKP